MQRYTFLVNQEIRNSKFSTWHHYFDVMHDVSDKVS